MGFSVKEDFLPQRRLKRSRLTYACFASGFSISIVLTSRASEIVLITHHYATYLRIVHTVTLHGVQFVFLSASIPQQRNCLYVAKFP